MNLKPRTHVLMAQQFRDPTVLLDLFRVTDRLVELEGNDEIHNESIRRTLARAVMYEIFYEPSTRTRFSFWAAAKMLGMDICSSESAGQFSSAVKGETLEHTIRILAGQNVQVIVIRHPETGAAQRAAAVVDKYYPGKSVRHQCRRWTRPASDPSPARCLYHLAEAWPRGQSHGGNRRRFGKRPNLPLARVSFVQV